jgi:hypothetical protein
MWIEDRTKHNRHFNIEHDKDSTKRRYSQTG